MAEPEPQICELLSSRICHDLIGPIAAIDNGLELLAMTGAGGPEIDLLRDSVRTANARVQFFRICFGAAPDGSTLAVKVFAGHLAALNTARLQVRITSPHLELPRAYARLLALLALCAEKALPFGGSISIRQLPRAWVLSGEGRSVRLEQELWSRLHDQAAAVADLSAAHVQFALAGQAAAGLGIQIQVKSGDRSFQVSLPA